MRYRLTMAAAAIAVASAIFDAAAAQDLGQRGVIDEWASVKAPQPPALAATRVDPSSTALLVLDMQNALAGAASRPRAAATVPAFARLLERARASGMFVAYSTIPNGAAADILEALAPRPGDPVVHSGVDKFFRTDLDDILRSHGIKTVIVTGTVANGAVLFTATGAALRGYKVVVPVDCMPGGDAYAEQFMAWQLVNGPGTRNAATLTTSTSLAF